MSTAIESVVKGALALLMTLITLLTGVMNPTVAPFVPADETDTPEEKEVMNIIENGRSDYVIVCAKTSGDSEYTAAVKLQSYLKQMSGVTLPIVSDETECSEKEIVVGKTNRESTCFTLDRDTFTDETERVFIDGERIVIAGGEKRGTLYGVYDFLKALGCRWFTSTLITIPNSNTVGVPVDTDISFTSPFEYRETDWLSPKDTEYSLANHLNSNIYRRLTAENGSYMGYAGGFCHTLTTSICAASKYFDAHPEYFAYFKGERTKDQLCLTNPEVLSIVIDEVKAIAATNPVSIISLTQNDNQHYCECDACRRLDEAEGSHSGTMITFVNAVADAIKQEYPGVAIDTFAYQYTRKPPKTVTPRSNVIVRLCSIECCFSHPLSDTTCEKNADFAKDIADWAKICNRLYVWDYTTNYANYVGPFPNFHVLQENMKFFKKNHVVGIYEEGNYTASESNAEFAEYRAYLLSALMYNPDCNLEQLSDEFLKAYYGKGWQYIKEYNRFTCKEVKDHVHMGIYNSMFDDSLFGFGSNEIEYLDNLWAKAKELAETDTQLENVQKSELSWRYWQALNMVSEYSRLKNASGWRNEHQKLYDDYVRFGVTRLCEGNSNPLTLKIDEIPSHWDDK